jgi:hypothetical protein
MAESGYQIPESTSSLTEAQQKELKKNKSKDVGALGMIQIKENLKNYFPKDYGSNKS